MESFFCLFHLAFCVKHIYTECDSDSHEENDFLIKGWKAERRQDPVCLWIFRAIKSTWGGGTACLSLSEQGCHRDQRLSLVACHWWVITAFSHLCPQLHLSWLMLSPLYIPFTRQHSASKQRGREWAQELAGSQYISVFYYYRAEVAFSWLGSAQSEQSKWLRYRGQQLKAQQKIHGLISRSMVVE